MKKSILISIRPEGVAKILNGEKTIEIRKTAPKCDLPIDVYIYCTKKGHFVQEEMESVDYTGWYDYPTGVYATFSKEEEMRHGRPLNGKVVAKFTLHKVDWLDIENARRLLDAACLTAEDAMSYARVNNDPDDLCCQLCAWNISDLEIFDLSKDLNEFEVKERAKGWQFMEVEE